MWSFQTLNGYVYFVALARSASTRRIR